MAVCGSAASKGGCQRKNSMSMETQLGLREAFQQTDDVLGLALSENTLVLSDSFEEVPTGFLEASDLKGG